MSSLKNRLLACLAAAWEAEMVGILALERLEAMTTSGRVRARLAKLITECQPRASHLLARMAAVGGGPLPVPPDDIDLPCDFSQAAHATANRARASSTRYALIAELARKSMDLSAAWVCEKNRAEELDLSAELDEMADRAAREEVAA